MTTFSADRSSARALDTAGQLAQFRDQFVRQDRDLIYLNGNWPGPPICAGLTEVFDTVNRLREIAAGKSYADIPVEP